MKTHFIIKRFLLGLALLASCDFGAFAKVVLPVLVSDGMVLQRNAPLTIWGKADPSEKVCVKFQKKQYKVTADENGKGCCRSDCRSLPVDFQLDCFYLFRSYG